MSPLGLEPSTQIFTILFFDRPLKRFVKRYQDPGLCAWLQMFFIFQGLNSAPTAKVPALNLLRLVTLRGIKTTFLTPNRWHEQPRLFYIGVIQTPDGWHSSLYMLILFSLCIPLAGLYQVKAAQISYWTTQMADFAFGFCKAVNVFFLNRAASPERNNKHIPYSYKRVHEKSRWAIWTASAGKFSKSRIGHS